MRVITIINQKGGCGKTTTAINLSSAFARGGMRTLLVDMDPQSHCAAGLGVPESRIDLDIGDAMLAPPTKVIDTSRLLWRAGRNLDLAPSRMRLAGLEAMRGGLADRPDRERRLTHVLDRFKSDFDVVVIDSSPSIGLLTYNALAAAQIVLIPVETGYFSLQGATRQVSTIKSLAKRLGVSVQTWLLATIHDDTSPVACDLLEELRRRFGHHVVPAVVRRDTKLREAASFGQPIHEFAPDSAGAADYAAVCRWCVDAWRLRSGEQLPPAAELPLPDEAPDAYEEPTSTVEVAPAERAAVVNPTGLAMELRAMLNASMGPASAAETDPAPAGVVATEPRPLGPSAEMPAPLSRAAELVQRAQRLLKKHEAPVDRAPVLRLEGDLEVKPDAAASTIASKLCGVRTTSQGVLFVQPASVGRRVSVAGSFNGWSPDTHVMSLNEALGVFELCIPLPPGRHQYRLVIDGVWVADRYNTEIQDNSLGDANNVVSVAMREELLAGA
ncbi:MAG: AAA family ATPase [Phycisphaeraceae bacterium]|nr:MAG: AAA family ATPase [Phycisphaeraceae bacterium]